MTFGKTQTCSYFRTTTWEIIRASMFYQNMSHWFSNSRLSRALKGAERSTRATRWPLILFFANVMHWILGNSNTDCPWLYCVLRVSFANICILVSLHRPSSTALKNPAKYIRGMVLHLVIAGLVCKQLIATSPTRINAQHPHFLSNLHYILCRTAFGMAGLPLIPVPLPKTVDMQCWLLTMFISTIIGAVLPSLRWYLYGEMHPPERRLQHASWGLAQILFLGSCIINVTWLTIALIAAAIE